MSREQKIYAAVILGLIGLVALARFDLVALAAQTTLTGLRRGGAFRNQLIGQILLFGAILVFTAWIIPQKKADLRRDAAAAALAAVLGFIVEAWGTRLGLWTYYTGEKPPLWIVPAWPLGALVIDRAAERLRRPVSGLSPANLKAVYWSLALLILGGFLAFTGDALASPSSFAITALLAGALLLFPEPGQDLPVLLAGAACVFFADLWGTMNLCWVYHVQSDGSVIAHAVGVMFGMFFDTTVILACLRCSRAAFPDRPE